MGKVDWSYCKNIQSLAEIDAMWARNLSDNNCDKIDCENCPLHPNKVELKKIKGV